ncbi:MAG: molybdopterin-guanine dinucleotide biosynthesis protein MobB [Rhodospirillales bacterium]|nr:molybdopterin-guanine dinucleotide biosynthesis protein MobB [Rhodospirillales bacterium]
MRLFGLSGADPAAVRGILLDLVAEFAGRGLAVATLHEAPAGFDPDTPGKDSHEHRKAGAREVRLISDHLEALAHENQPGEPSDPQRLARRLAPADLVLVEGFAAHTHPQIRVGEGEDGPGDAKLVARVRPDADRRALADLVWAKAQRMTP